MAEPEYLTIVICKRADGRKTMHKRKDQQREYMREYRKRNPEVSRRKAREYARVWRARKKAEITEQ